MADSQQSPAHEILSEILTEYRGRISIDGGSKILVMDPTIAHQVADMYKDIATPYGPSFTIATADPNSQPKDEGQNITSEPLSGLESKMDHFSHALVDVTNADGKTCMAIMKWAKHALQPKGVCVAVAMKVDGNGQSFKEKMEAQSKNRVHTLADVLEFAGFEIGKIKSLDQAEAEVVLAMKWDQLTA